MFSGMLEGHFGGGEAKKCFQNQTSFLKLSLFVQV